MTAVTSRADGYETPPPDWPSDPVERQLARDRVLFWANRRGLHPGRPVGQSQTGRATGPVAVRRQDP